MDRMTAAEYRALAETPKKRWSAAKPGTCAEGHAHASKMEARVCGRLTLECQATGRTLYQQVTLPLWSLAPDARGKASTARVDFGIVEGGRLVRLVDAKSRRVSREWRRGALAVKAAYGIEVEEVDR